MNERNIGIDLLRLLAMFMIVLLHINLRAYLYIDFLSIYVFESFSIVAVNCFVLISGFFLIKQQFRLKKLTSLIFEICFYTWVCFIAALIINIPMDIKMLIQGFFTISSGFHWFITCYIMLYILFPFINKFIYSLSLKQKHIFAILTILLFCIWTTVPNINRQSAIRGYSILWLCVLYYFGAYLRLVFVEGDKKELFNKISNFSGYGYIIFSLITVFFMFLLNLINKDVGIALNYNSLFVFFAAICLFIFMYSLNIKNKSINKIITFFAPASFGVFLLSDNLFVIYYQKIYLTKDFFLQSFNMPLMVLICAVSIYIVCLLISSIFHKRIFNFSDKYIYPIIEKIYIKTLK
ncbi:acyltransferase [Candidatus Ruminimicrobium bovinum]|uniref:acyltransferase n=1 Tax=Candidatus Ruminimicrobium bovinum TaxID=3242779 RepID=UPI0039B8E669